ncbi:MAG: preprotein translocase subunit SecG [Paracoccaceae bacterium]|jgi:preprotein translocase subunit SecG|nr:preprotein translocase subunit SecG [Paracoccaceae bacterium]
MENVVLSVHLILAVLLIGVVLLQRSEGGGLGMGGGGGGGVMSGRQAANALSKLTWILAAGFIVTSVTLTILAARKAEEGSVVDRVVAPVEAPAAVIPAAPAVELPPAAADAPVTPPPAN